MVINLQEYKKSISEEKILMTENEIIECMREQEILESILKRKKKKEYALKIVK